MYQRSTYTYALRQLGGGTQILRFAGGPSGFRFEDLLRIGVDRSSYLYRVRTCAETATAIGHLNLAREAYADYLGHLHAPAFSVVDAGHIYATATVVRTEILQFVKRSSGIITYAEEWPGVQTQEMFRALIGHLEWKQATEGAYIEPLEEIADFIREALYQYEVRAWRRKQESANRTKYDHDDTERHRPWRAEPDGVPFTSYQIERRPIGSDGHILLSEEHA